MNSPRITVSLVLSVLLSATAFGDKPAAAPSTPTPGAKKDCPLCKTSSRAALLSGRLAPQNNEKPKGTELHYLLSSNETSAAKTANAFIKQRSDHAQLSELLPVLGRIALLQLDVGVAGINVILIAHKAADHIRQHLAFFSMGKVHVAYSPIIILEMILR